MTEAVAAEEKKTTMERHVQTILAGVITILMAWVGNAVVTSSENVARLEERLNSLNQEVQLIREKLNDQYTARDAERDLSALRAEITANRDLARANSDRISRLEIK